MQVSKRTALDMRRAFWRGLILSFSTLCFVASAATDPEDATSWEQQFRGSTSVQGIGKVQYSMGYRSVGFDHYATEITIDWQQGQSSSTKQQAQQQLLYEGIHDKPPAKLWGEGRYLCLAMQTCARYSDSCNWQTLAYRFEPASQSFAETKRSARLCRMPRK